MKNLTENVSLATHTTLGVGGIARQFCSVHSETELKEAIQYSLSNNLPVTILGGGSNVLITDDEILGLVIKNEIAGSVEQSTGDGTILLTLGAGEWFDDVVDETTKKEWWGLENLSGIPGTVGGGVVQNINAYGVTIGNLVVSVTAYQISTGQKRTFTAAECQFDYRNSYFKEPTGRSDWVISEVVLALSKKAVGATQYQSASQSLARNLVESGITEPTPKDIRTEVLRIRSTIGMLSGQFKSAGSYFKNPIVSKDQFLKINTIVEERWTEKSAALSPWHWELPDQKIKVSAAFLLECTPYNKTDYASQSFNGTVGISPRHSLSIVNVGGATATDIRQFVEIINDTIEKTFSIRLEPEVCYLDN